MKQFLCFRLAEIDYPHVVVVSAPDREVAKTMLKKWLRERYTAAAVTDDAPLLNCFVITELPTENGVHVIEN